MARGVRACPAKVRRFVNIPVADWESATPGRRRKKCTRFRNSCGARFYSRAQSSYMKTAAQSIETADTIELVPQILHLKKILVPTDFSDTSKKAVQYAVRFAEQF